MSLVGIDISQRMIEYARAQAKAHQVNDRVEFRVMDALCTLDFPAACFDLGINLRFGSSFVRTWDWPKVVTELLRVTCLGGIVRVTDTEIHQSNSPVLMQLSEMFLCAFFRSGHLFLSNKKGQD